MLNTTLNLFEATEELQAGCQQLSPGAVVLRGFAMPDDKKIFAALRHITAVAPFRYMVTPGGFRMSVAMTNCGSYGWVTDLTGYRYEVVDPESEELWPPMPQVFLKLAQEAAVYAGFENFQPDACLINRYHAGTRLSLHQDKNEHDYTAPIVSVSLGIPAIFLWGGLHRDDKTRRVPLLHGDVVVWGGPARLHYHGVLPVKEGYHSLTGLCRINLTFRRVV
jgi:alkylated DNA repair protein (DNA oxidative demethylase)